MTPCNRPRKLMSNASWLAFIRKHPHWVAPIVAPCSLAAGVALYHVAPRISAWFFLPRSAPPVEAWAPPAIPANPAEWATYAGTPVPEPSSLPVLIVAVVVLLAWLRWCR